MRSQQPPVSTSSQQFPHGSSAVEQALQQARTLHRASRATALCDAMPAVRRAHGAGMFSELSLSALIRQRHILQRKHFLHTLAVEAGFAHWEAYLPVLRAQTPQTIGQYGAMFDLGYPNLWFSTHEQAQNYADKFGGWVWVHGKQAMVVAKSTEHLGGLRQEAQHAQS